MTEKRYFKREWEEEYYIFDSTNITEEKVDRESEYGYDVFADSMQGDEVVDRLNEQEEQIRELEQEKESWKYSACHDMNLKSMLSFEIGRLTETKDVDSFLDFYYKHFCKSSGDVE